MKPSFIKHASTPGRIASFVSAICVLAFPSFPALFAQTAIAPATAPAMANKPLPSKQEVLAAMKIIEDKLPDSSAFEAVETVVRFVNESPDVVVTITRVAMPWMEESGVDDAKRNYLTQRFLFAAYCSGDARAQVQKKGSAENPLAGWEVVLAVHEKMARIGLGRMPSIKRLATLKQEGALAEYAAVVTRDVAAAKKAAATGQSPDKISAKQRLTRDFLAPAHDLVAHQEYEKASELYGKWLAQNPDDTDALFDFGYVLYLRGNTANNAEVRRGYYLAARPFLLKAYVLGSNNPQLEGLLVNTDVNRAENQNKF